MKLATRSRKFDGKILMAIAVAGDDDSEVICCWTFEVQDKCDSIAQQVYLCVHLT